MKLNRNGVLLLDKPKGISSNRALVIVKKIFNAKKAGHAGTLDPLATGILPILFGEATKFAEFGLESDKKYIAEIALGTKTSTGDTEGEIIEENFFKNDKNIDLVLKSFIGVQLQIPPMYSALKYKGKPLYKYARAGQEISRKSRPINIKSIKFVSLRKYFLKVNVTCSKGTYIRTLAEDIGERLGSCAHLSELRRIGVADLGIDQTVNLERLELLANVIPDNLDNELMPIELFIKNWPFLKLEIKEENNFLNGQPIDSFLFDTKGNNKCLVRVYGALNNFLGTGQINENKILRPIRSISK